MGTLSEKERTHERSKELRFLLLERGMIYFEEYEAVLVMADILTGYAN